MLAATVITISSQVFKEVSQPWGHLQTEGRALKVYSVLFTFLCCQKDEDLGVRALFYRSNLSSGNLKYHILKQAVLSNNKRSSQPIFF